MRIRLRVETAPGAGRPFEHAGPRVVIGRDPKCELSFAADGTPVASWRHAQIDLSPAGALLTDLGSTNGTYLNDERLASPTPLAVDDVIRLGRRGPKMTVVELDFSAAAPPATPRRPASKPPRPPVLATPPKPRTPAAPQPPARPPKKPPTEPDVPPELDFPPERLLEALPPTLAGPPPKPVRRSPTEPEAAFPPERLVEDLPTLPPAPHAPAGSLSPWQAAPPPPPEVTPPPSRPRRPPAPPPAAPDLLPEQFGRYRIVKQLGKGSMGAVYLAHDTQLDRPVALKVPSFGPDEDSTLHDRFYREARAAATLQHPCICPVYDVGEIDRKLYLTMAYIEGKPLAQVLKERGAPLPLDEAAELVRKLAEAMDEAHSRDVIHRDLKPTNILVNRRGDPVLIDFGLARREGKNDARLTATGAILGTPAYMAPELASGHASVAGPSCDIYSLGVILYELVTGSIPFRGSLGQVLGMIPNQEPAPVRQRRPDADERIEAICRKAMAKKPEDRFASMGDFARALGDYLRGRRR